MNSSEIFTLALGLSDPWSITNVEILTDEDSVKGLHIHLEFKRGSKFEDEVGEKCFIHDTQDKKLMTSGLREQYIHAHVVMLQAMGNIGADLLSNFESN